MSLAEGRCHRRRCWIGGDFVGVVIRKPRHISGVSYQWFKIVGPAQDYADTGLIQVTEIKINETSPTAAAAAASYSLDYVVGNVIDGNTTTAWCTPLLEQGAPVWLAVEMSETMTIAKLSLRPRPSLGSRLFDDFAVYGSNDSTNGSNGTWTLIASGLTRSDNDDRWHEWTF
jgi:hypothetical protein